MVLLIITLVILYVFSIGVTKALLDNLALIGKLINDLCLCRAGYMAVNSHELKAKSNKNVVKYIFTTYTNITADALHHDYRIQVNE